ncbi:unnamed protein product, partial [Polarella glacialis]
VGLFSGVASPLAGVTPYWMLNYWAYRLACDAQLSGDQLRPPTVAEASVSGMFSGLVSGGLRCLFDNVKANAQVQSGGTWHAAQALWRSDGPRGLCRGMSTTVVYNGFSQAIYYSTYEWFNANLPTDTLNPAVRTFIAGAMAGLFRWVPFMLPVDIVRQRLYLGTSTSAMAAARAIWAEGGTRAFYRGFWPTVLRSVFANGAALTGITQTEKLLRAWRE